MQACNLMQGNQIYVLNALERLSDFMNLSQFLHLRGFYFYAVTVVGCLARIFAEYEHVQVALKEARTC